MAHILIVDDEGPIREILKRLVTGAGHTAAEADSAEAALEAMAATPAAVVFCDVDMPGQGGLWLTSKLREQYPTAAAILATGIATIPPTVSLRSGIVAYLLKPFDQKQVLSALDMALAWHEETAAKGPKPEDAADRVQAWLDGLKGLQR